MVFGVEVPIRVKEVSLDNMCTILVQLFRLIIISQINKNEHPSYIAFDIGDV